MSKEIKSKIYKLIEEIDDEKVLNQVMEDVVFYTKTKDIIDELSPAQIEELDEAIKEADKGETIPWGKFKQEMEGWKKK